MILIKDKDYEAPEPEIVNGIPVPVDKNAGWIEGEPTVGEPYREQIGVAWIEKIYAEPLPIISLSNVSIQGAEKVGEIHWLGLHSQFLMTGDLNLPDSQFVMMAERVLDGSKKIDDVRFKATVKNNAVEVSGAFDVSGNYLITAERMNKGLSRINAPFRLSFDDIEFDIYVN